MRQRTSRPGARRRASGRGPDSGRRSGPLQAGLVSLGTSDWMGLLGRQPVLPGLPEPAPAVRETASPWAHPLDAILSFLGRDLHEALEDPAVAREAATLWECRRAARGGGDEDLAARGP